MKWRRVKDKVAGRSMLLAIAFANSIVLLIALGLFVKSRPILAKESILHLLFSSSWAPLRGEFGFLPFHCGNDRGDGDRHGINGSGVSPERHLPLRICPPTCEGTDTSGRRYHGRNSIGHLWTLGHHCRCALSYGVWATPLAIRPPGTVFCPAESFSA